MINLSGTIDWRGTYGQFSKFEAAWIISAMLLQIKDQRKKARAGALARSAAEQWPADVEGFDPPYRQKVGHLERAAGKHGEGGAGFAEKRSG